MAEIPVQRKSGIPWWAWLLLALIVLGLLIWWATGDDDTPYVEPAPVTGAVAPADATVETAATGPITDIATILAAPDRSALAGRDVQLSGVQVQRVVGDRTFLVGPNADQTLFVVLNEVPTPGQPGTEGRYDVTQGQVVNVNGTMRSVNDPAFGGQPIEGLPAGTDTVIHAQSLDIVQRP